MTGTSSTPVFIVGVPRSGTTVLASMIAGHTGFVVGPETHFFRTLSDRRLRRAISDDRWPREAVAALMRIEVNDTSVAEQVHVTEATLWKRLEDRPATAESMIRALTATPAPDRLLAEKTPGHLAHIERIWRYVPGARVVHMVRDPRDVARSLAKVPWTSFSSEIAGAFEWSKRLAESEAALRSRQDLVYNLRYEDLVRDPELELRGLCGFLRCDFEAQMLDVEDHASSVVADGEHWKSRNAGKLVSTRSGAWRDEGSESGAKAVELLCSEQMESFGYESDCVVDRRELLLPLSGPALDAIEAQVVALALRDVSIEFTTRFLDPRPLGVASREMRKLLPRRLALTHFVAAMVRSCLRLPIVRLVPSAPRPSMP
ncbi:sulfotransferase [Demequina sp. NBRC 110056]|uniref:sulfotransferase family protein n=1 Tax=Demequina sp. NBRC 110056 TaxID=1570345 RepID=UPI001356372F|nr:sulfotransferase [Demequina sp. NBRC 110056]